MNYSTRSFITSEKVVPSFEKDLSIILKNDGFAFTITSTKNEFLTFGDFQIEGSPNMTEAIAIVKQVFADNSILLFGFHSARLVVETEQFVWIPDSLYQEGNDRMALAAVCPIPIGKSVLNYHNDQIQARIVFTADNAWVSAFKIAIPGIKITCQYAALLNEYSVLQSDLKSILLVQVRDGISDFIVLCNKKLQLCNTYSCANFDEAVYHALNLTSQLHLGEAEMELWLCGDVNREQFTQARRFFSKVNLYKGRPLQFGNPDMYTIHTHRIASILG
ncbi:MAG: DUF3822 family protein [Bacteroidales bacterium]|nr:DUF3822 family protein [Bacteroidales bacterium]